MLSQCKDAKDNPAALFERMRRRGWRELSGVFFARMKRVNSKCSSVQLRANRAIYSRHSCLVWKRTLSIKLEYKPGSSHEASRWKRLSSRDQWNLTPATMCRLCSARCMKQTLWRSADHALACVRPRQILTHSSTFSKNGRGLEPWMVHKWSVITSTLVQKRFNQKEQKGWCCMWIQFQWHRINSQNENHVFPPNGLVLS